jgi:predicted type IV restriction endonuclease
MGDNMASAQQASAHHSTAQQTTLADVRLALSDLAKRAQSVAKACNNDESTKLYLVLPMLRALGYDVTDPLEVYPNHETDPVSGDGGPKVYVADFAILRSGSPVIAIGANRNAADLAAKKQSIAMYFSAWPTTKVGVLSNGMVFDFFVDSHEPGIMDDEPFLTVDLATMVENGAPEEVADTLVYATKAQLDPDKIAERAHLQLVKKRLRAAFVEEAQGPSEDLCRAMMGRVGFPGVRREAIERHYGTLVKAAFEEALVLPVVQKLRAGGVGEGVAGGIKLDVSQSLSAAEGDLALMQALRRRLAFLCETEAQFQAIEHLRLTSNVGKLIAYFDRDPDGRVVEIVRGSGSLNRYVFADGDVITANLAELDAPLKAAFMTALSKLDVATPGRLRKAG